MDIVTEEQIGELNDLIKKYGHPELVSETVAEQVVTIIKYTDVSALEKRKRELVTQEQCKNIVTAASALLKNMPDVRTFALLLNRNSSVFCFDPLFFMERCYLTVLIDKRKGDVESSRANVFISGISTEEEKHINYDKIVETYTNLTSFCEYIKKYPLTKFDVLKIISPKENH